MSRPHHRLLLIVALLIGATAARAGDDTAVITIVASLTDGGSVQGLEVRVDDVTRRTDARGVVRFLVTPGQHLIAFINGGPGASVYVAAGQKVRWNIRYCATCISDWITITLPTIEADDAPINTPLFGELRMLPLGRSITDVARLAPGAQPETALSPNDAFFADGIHGDEMHLGFPAMYLPVDFFQAVNVISGAPPAELGHASRNLILATTRRHGPRMSAWTYAQPSIHAERGGVRADHREWDAGVAFSNRWFFAAYDHASGRDVIEYLGSRSTTRIGTDAFFVRAEGHVNPQLTITGQLAGDPATLHYDLGPQPVGSIAESLRALAVVRDTTIDATVSHQEQRQGSWSNAIGNRARVDFARDLGAHLLRAGVEREQMREPLSHARYTAAYLTDMWQPDPRLTINAGVRAEEVTADIPPNGIILLQHFDERVLSPHGSIVWMWTPNVRVFGTFANTADDMPLALNATYIFPPRHEDETTAGIERIGRGLGGGLRLIHRRHRNAALLTSTLTHFRASYVYTSTDIHALDAFFSAAPRRHNVIAQWSRPFDQRFTAGAIAQWMSSAPVSTTRLPAYFSADVHAGVRMSKAELVIDVFNVFGNQSALLNPELPAFAFDPLYAVSAWQAPRTIRFGVRAGM